MDVNRKFKLDHSDDNQSPEKNTNQDSHKSKDSTPGPDQFHMAGEGTDKPCSSQSQLENEITPDVPPKPPDSLASATWLEEVIQIFKCSSFLIMITEHNLSFSKSLGHTFVSKTNNFKFKYICCHFFLDRRVETRMVF